MFNNNNENMIDISTFDDILIIDDFFSQEEIENQPKNTKFKIKEN